MKTQSLGTDQRGGSELKVTYSSAAVYEEGRHHTRLWELYNAALELIKIRITFFVGMSAAFGYLLANGNVSGGMVLPVLGIFLLSCASAAANQYQEVATDVLMHRTSKRPLPAGVVTPAFVLTFILILSAIGSTLILLTGNLTALVLAWLAFISYNGVYTPLKKVTPFAVIPGSFVGSFPVMAGWAAAGGQLLDARLIAVAVFFFIWQIPHFWLLMDLYSVDYERAKFPTLRLIYKEAAISVLIYAWMIALAISSLLFITSGVVDNLFGRIGLAALGIWLALSTFPIVQQSVDKRATKAAFMKINVYVLAVTLLVMIDKLMRILVK